MPRRAESPLPARWAGRFRSAATALGVVVACAAIVAGARAQEGAAGSPADVAAVRAAATAYRAALAAGDVERVKAAWTSDGDIVDGWGRRFDARDAGVIDGGPGAAAVPRPEFRVHESQLRFVAADVAVEDGTVDVVFPGTKNPIEGWFSAIWVRRGDTWKLAGLRESERPTATDADMLEDLEWLVGDWVTEADEAAGPAMEMSVRWDAGRAFLVREVRVPVPDAAADAPNVVKIDQRIGWDPVVRRIRSWSFSSDGSRGEATWFRDGDSWVAVQTAVSPDGRQESRVHIYSYDGRDRCVWRTLPDALDADDGRPARTTWVRTPRGDDR